MRRHQPFAYIIFGAFLGGILVFQLSNNQTPILFDDTTKRSLLTRANRTTSSPHEAPGEIHAHDHEGVDRQEQLFAFQHEHGWFNTWL
jgi:hypothetical protein